MDFTGWITPGLDFMKVHLFDVKQSLFGHPLSDSSSHMDFACCIKTEFLQPQMPLSSTSPVSINLTLVQINKPEDFAFPASVVSALSEG